MKLAIMQPYFFPYLGYWQLLQAVDRFVIYDDVSYIKGGWVNRNRILVNGKPTFITVPLLGASSFKRICDIRLSAAGPWRMKLPKMLELTYARAPHFPSMFPQLTRLIQYETDDLSNYLCHQISGVAKLLGIQTEIVVSHGRYGNESLAGQARVLDICHHENGDRYFNTSGGMALYDTKAFAQEGIELSFLTHLPTPYRQRSPGFIPQLSIIDALMELGVDGVRAQLDSYRLSQGLHG